MKLFLSDINPNTKIFLGDLDSYTIIQNNLSQDHIMFYIKLSSLLYDKTIIPAAFFWQSEMMINLMPKIEPLVKYEILLPSIRNSSITRDLLDYHEKRQSETFTLLNSSAFHIPSVASEMALPKHKKIAHSLQDMNTMLYLDSGSVEAEYKCKWLYDLEDATKIDTINSIIYQCGYPPDLFYQIIDLLKLAKDISPFSRSGLINYVLNLNSVDMINKHTLDRVINRISWIYLDSYAKAMNSDLFVTSLLYNGSVYCSNLNLFFQTLKLFGIDKNLINKLTITDLLHIRNSDEYQLFITSYFSLVNEIKLEEKEFVSYILSSEKIILQTEMVERFSYSAFSKIFIISSTIFLSLIANILSGTQINQSHILIGGLSATSYFLKHIDNFNGKMGSTPFLDFKEYMLRAEYRKKIQDKVGGHLF